jgi:hypothetical protein
MCGGEPATMADRRAVPVRFSVWLGRSIGPVERDALGHLFAGAIGQE